MKTYLSGIQPSGLQHLGNYFGAIEQHIRLQGEQGHQFYFIADYHALTTVRDPGELRDRVRETAVTYLALGLDPERAVLFKQSDVPEVCELTWLLANQCGMGLLERAHSYKDKVAKGISPHAGLFLYPVLMAADILAYDSDFVPVGADQKQHVEIARDLAGSFNNAYGEVFRVPEVVFSRHQKVPGVDGEKMSKSYGNDIWVFETGKKLKKAVGRIVTDSRAPADPKDPSSVLLYAFLELFLEADELASWAGRLRAGGVDGPGYGHLKVRLIEAVEERFRGARERRAELLADPAQVDAVLAAGAARARARAVATRDRALAACGLR